MAEPARRYGIYSRSFDAVVLASVLVLSGFLTAMLLRIGWVPSDEGTLAASAMRVYQGQLPHRDYAEIYTGGLSFFHAAAFHLFGLNLLSMRIAAFLLFLLWLLAVYAIVRRFLSPMWAAVATLTAVGWSYPNYPAAMPSWYNLFLATFGLWALLRFLERESSWWLALAGVFGGASILVKITGLYYVAGVLLFLLFWEQDAKHVSTECAAPRFYRKLVGTGLALYLAAIARLLAGELRAAEMFQFLLPAATCAGLLIVRDSRTPGRSSSQRLKTLLRTILPFLAGAAAVIGLYAVPYLRSGSVHLLVHGVFGSASERVTGLAGRSPVAGPSFALYGLVVISLIGCGLFVSWSCHRAVTLLFAAALVAVLACSVCLSGLQDTWMMAGTLTPFAVLLAAPLLVRREGTHVLAQRRIMLFIAMAATGTLIQFPVGYVTYFLYVAPFTLFAVIAIVSSKEQVPGRQLLAVLSLFFLGLGWLGVVTKHVFNPEFQYSQRHTLPLARMGGLLVDSSTPPYDVLIPLLQKHASDGNLIAANDCPELYFLSGLKNLTRDDTGISASDLLAAVNAGSVNAVAFNDQPFFASGNIAPQTRAALIRLLPNTAKVGRFSVYWR